MRLHSYIRSAVVSHLSLPIIPTSPIFHWAATRPLEPVKIQSSGARMTSQALNTALRMAIEIYQVYGYVVEPTFNGALFHFSLSDPKEDFDQRMKTFLDWKPSEQLRGVGDNLGVKIKQRPSPPDSDRAEVKRRDRHLRERFELALEERVLEVGREELVMDLAREMSVTGGRFIVGADETNVDRYWKSLLEKLVLERREVCEVVVSSELPPGAKRPSFIISVHVPDIEDQDACENVVNTLVDAGVTKKAGAPLLRPHAYDVLGISSPGSEAPPEQCSRKSTNGSMKGWMARFMAKVAR